LPASLGLFKINFLLTYFAAANLELFSFNRVGLWIFQHISIIHSPKMKNVLLRLFILTFIAGGIIVCAAGCSNNNDYEIYGAIHGVITDISSGQPLDNATVVLSPSGLSIQTDVNGSYKFENLEIQQYTVTVQKLGYQANRKVISVVPGEDFQVDIQLTQIPQ
ncbi:MAG: carboxypeptidase-like regulatory domain-containing protein, partial [Paramuribaculum sp.]|nr:carboxypeptidase-like regulatory domain-containing protein [Paramuribaculum sp.]